MHIFTLPFFPAHQHQEFLQKSWLWKVSGYPCHRVPGWPSVESFLSFGPVLQQAKDNAVPFKMFGWLINLNKSALKLFHHLKYLGSRQFSFPRKRLLLWNPVAWLGSTRHSMTHFCLRVLGLVVTSFKVVPFAQLHVRPLQINILTMWHKNWSFLWIAHYCCPSRKKTPLAWWISYLALELRKSCLRLLGR